MFSNLDFGKKNLCLLEIDFQNFFNLMKISGFLQYRTNIYSRNIPKKFNWNFLFHKLYYVALFITINPVHCAARNIDTTAINECWLLLFAHIYLR